MTEKYLTEEEFFALVEKSFPKKWVSSVLIKHDEIKQYENSNSKNRKEPMTKMYLYTDTNEYCISIRNNQFGGYLGCVAGSRKERPGENWKRGNDLADGKLTKETWYEILEDIVEYELVKVHRNDEPKVFSVAVADDITKEDIIKNITETFKNKPMTQPDPSRNQTEKANNTAKELYEYFGSPAGMLTVGATWNPDMGIYNLIVYVFTTSITKFWIHKINNFKGYSISYVECDIPTAYANNT